MADDYPFERLGKLASVQGGFPFKSNDFSGSGVPVLKIKNVRQREIETSEVEYVSEEVARANSRYFCRTGDILISMTGSGPQAPNSIVGRVARFVGPSDRYLINQRVGRFVIRERSTLDSRFLFYVLMQSEIQWSLVSIATGSANQANISVGQIETIEIPLPSFPEQKAIAHILGTLDDKIELNRRMTATLEAMARALFTSWFVDFDPVRAKAEGRDPGLPKPLADLFPDRFEDSELGKVPKGWEVRSVGAFIKRLRVGKKYEQKTVSSIGKVPVLDQGKTGVIGYHDDEPGVVASKERPIAVFANHTCYMRLIHFPCSTIQNVLPFVGKGVDTIWAYYATYGKQSFIEYKGHWPDFVIHEIVVPSRELTVQFSRLVHPLLKTTWVQESESRTLATLRDALLPKLVAGELRVKDAERQIAQAI